MPLQQKFKVPPVIIFKTNNDKQTSKFIIDLIKQMKEIGYEKCGGIDNNEVEKMRALMNHFSYLKGEDNKYGFDTAGDIIAFMEELNQVIEYEQIADPIFFTGDGVKSVSFEMGKFVQCLIERAEEGKSYIGLSQFGYFEQIVEKIPKADKNKFVLLLVRSNDSWIWENKINKFVKENNLKMNLFSLRITSSIATNQKLQCFIIETLKNMSAYYRHRIPLENEPILVRRLKEEYQLPFSAYLLKSDLYEVTAYFYISELEKEKFQKIQENIAKLPQAIHDKLQKRVKNGLHYYEINGINEGKIATVIQSALNETVDKRRRVFMP